MIEYVIFGESHGPAIGVTVSGLPAGVELNIATIEKEMARRSPGKSPLASSRKEGDYFEIISGFFQGKTTGTPLTALIPNNDVQSKDYSELRTHPRPGHADYAAWVRYGGNADYRGGGHFSGRLTAPLVFAGAVAKQILAQRGIKVAAHINNIFGICDATLENPEDLLPLAEKPFAVLDDEMGREMQAAIQEIMAEGDSVGGSIECAVWGLPAGVGDPDLGKNVEGIFAKHLFAVPAVKAVGFGMGSAFSLMRGSEANDPFLLQDGKISTETNYTGGVNGGITNGMPVVVEATLRPTPSIALPQQSVDLEKMEEYELSVTGRHDPCIVPRAVPVIEAAAALATCELLGV